MIDRTSRIDGALGITKEVRDLLRMANGMVPAPFLKATPLSLLWRTPERPRRTHHFQLPF